MVTAAEVTNGLDVVSSDGKTIGQVERVEGERIKLRRAGSTTDLYVPLSSVARVDQHVHLNRTAAAVTGLAAGTGTTSTGAGVAEVTRKTNWLPWLALLAALLALLLFGLRGCDRKPAAQVTETVTTTTSVVALPGGTSVNLAPGTLNYDLQRFLASGDAAPKTLTFDKLNFDTASSAIRNEDVPTLDALGQILAAYPNAKVKIVGYTDTRGSPGANAQLGAARAQSVAQALVAKGIAADRIATASGGESDPAATNATSSGMAENRRTELVVTAK